jgi:uncharacterized protein involved in propanediol utilization
MNQNPAPGVNPNPGPAATEIAGHFGELAQGRLGPDGPVALVTLPCPVLVTRVGYTPTRGPLRAAEPVSEKALAAARLALDEIGAAGWGGSLAIDRPAVPGLGLGSSTAEALGAVRAVAGAFATRLPPEREAALCLAVEGAVDPLMWPRPVLFASRQGRVVAPLGPLPPLRIVGGTAGPPQPTDPADDRFPDASALFRSLTAAIGAGDLPALAAAAGASAAANQARNPNPAWEAMQALARRHGALGLVVSHTGPAIGLILAPESDDEALPGALRELGLAAVTDYRLSAD